MADTANLEKNEEVERLKKELIDQQREMESQIKGQEEELRRTFMEQEMKW